MKTNKPELAGFESLSVIWLHRTPLGSRDSSLGPHTAHGHSHWPPRGHLPGQQPRWTCTPGSARSYLLPVLQVAVPGLKEAQKTGFYINHINVPVHTLDPVTPHNSMEAVPEMLTKARKG